MRYTFIDCETTGLDWAAGHRIIEIAMLTYDSDTRKCVDTWGQRINPQRSIDPKAQEVHGIAFTDLTGYPTWKEVAPEVLKRWECADLLVAHNMAFDGPFIVSEFVRCEIAVPERKLFCTMENGRWACFDGKFPKLSELCFALGVNYNHDMAHGASYDATVLAECFFRGVGRGFFKPFE
jgi:DNA polymerase-3 subunit epsilon